MAASTEQEMPELKVLRVDEVPTVKADPVDPVAREQAKVRASVCVCVCVCVCLRVRGVRCRYCLGERGYRISWCSS